MKEVGDLWGLLITADYFLYAHNAFTAILVLHGNFTNT